MSVPSLCCRSYKATGTQGTERKEQTREKGEREEGLLSLYNRHIYYHGDKRTRTRPHVEINACGEVSRVCPRDEVKVAKV